MRPYFDRDGITLYRGDAMDVLPNLPDVDLLLTDPPYGVEWRSNLRAKPFKHIANDRPSDREAVLQALGSACARVRPNRHAYIFGRLSDEEADRLRLARTAELIWDKVGIGAGDLSIPWAPQHEPITFGVVRRDIKSKATREAVGGLTARMRRGSVLREQRPNATGVRAHPTEKPVGILRQMIESSTVMGDLILDPFAGSGSTLVAALLEGRRAVGIEIEERYCESAAATLDRMTQQADMFARSSRGGRGSP